uniref:Helitron helicase-like domain-containing protein n=1 Tax=Brassica oleracea var. oleracea TaxID=109376 RepID=A0A0D3DJU4_BRAOL
MVSMVFTPRSHYILRQALQEQGGRVLHQYVVDFYTAIEEDRLRWARNNQDVLRAELYSNVLDAVSKGDTDAKIIGQRFILPPSFTGGPRYLVEKYHDALAICREYGNPNLFITMTANPNWREIKEHLGKKVEILPMIDQTLNVESSK